MLIQATRVSPESQEQENIGVQSKDVSIYTPRNQQKSLSMELLEDLIDGVLLLTEERKVLYENEYAQRILRQLNFEQSPIKPVPEEIWCICRTLIESRDLFPGQHWSIESQVSVNSSLTLSLKVRWLKLESMATPCLLLMMKDQYQSVRDLAIAEAKTFQLTVREQEVWLLYRSNYTYKQISEELYITLNTVKKHMKSIHAKRKSVLDLDDL